MKKKQIPEQKQVAEIVREAGKLLLNRHIEIRQKGNASNYVTSCDIAVQEFLSAKLKEYLPGSLVIGEESDDNPTDGEWLWIIDPIDGTSNFIRDIGMSAISVGLGDFAHSHLCSAMSLYDKRFAPPCFRIIDRVYQEADDLRRLGSAAVELVYLACGRVELYFEIRLFPWDAAGAIPIIREAGGTVEVLYEDRLPLDRPFPVVAANNQENFQRLMTIVKEELPKTPY